MSTRSQTLYDAIVVGGRCAGASTAMLLARSGLRVLLVERSGIPSDTFRNHYVQPPGIAKLADWGLLEAVKSSGCPRITRFTSDLGDFPLTVEIPLEGNADGAYGPRRFILDEILVRAASEAGVEVRDRFSVAEILFDHDTVVGIRGRSKGGAEVSEYASIVIGADGEHSTVAKSVRARQYRVRPSLTFGYFSYFEAVGFADTRAAISNRRLRLAFPTNHDLWCVAVQGPTQDFAQFRMDIEQSFFDAIEQVPWMADVIKRERRVEGWYGSSRLPNFYRKPYGPGWALVGDAGYLKDPITAQGISDAFRDADLLAAAVVTSLGGGAPHGSSLDEYERNRNLASQEQFDETVRMASFANPPHEVFERRAHLRQATG